MSKKHTTVEDLAIMVKRGFDETAKKRDVDEVNNRLGRIEEKVENIEKLMLKQHAFQIQNLEKRMKRVEDLFAIS